MFTFTLWIVGIEFLDLNTKFKRNERFWVQNGLLRMILLIFGFATYRTLCFFTNPEVHSCVGLPPNQVKLFTVLMIYEIGMLVNIYFFYFTYRDINNDEYHDDWDDVITFVMSILNWLTTVILWN